MGSYYDDRSFYGMAGRDGGARAEVAEVLRNKTQVVLKGGFYKNKADTERFMNALRKVRLK